MDASIAAASYREVEDVRAEAVHREIAEGNVAWEFVGAKKRGVCQPGPLADVEINEFM
jgi:hypothetical protein